MKPKTMKTICYSNQDQTDEVNLPNMLGKPLTPDQAAKILGVCGNTMRKHYKRLGGFQVAPGIIRFFENSLMEILNANNRQETEEWSTISCSSTSSGKKKGKDISIHQEGISRSIELGRKDSKKDDEYDSSRKNRHGLIDSD